VREFFLLLNLIEANQTSSRPKKIAQQRLRRGDFVSVVYYDIEKEQIKLQQFTGRCQSRRSRGLNSTFSVAGIINKIHIKQLFFFYSRQLLDVSIL
jgi:ribosomal protein L19